MSNIAGKSVGVLNHAHFSNSCPFLEDGKWVSGIMRVWGIM